jgi:hypothetical protein
VWSGKSLIYSHPLVRVLRRGFGSRLLCYFVNRVRAGQYIEKEDR